VFTLSLGISIAGMMLVVNPVSWAEVSSSIHGIIAIDSKQFDSTYSQWTSKWWQWAYSVPADVNPIADTTGKNCGQGQKGPVWFLAGTTGGAAERTCTVPAGKSTLFPIIVAECSYAEYPKLTTEEQLRSCAMTQNDRVNLAATVDGMSIPDLQTYRVQSPLFSFTVPANNIVGIKGGTTTQGVSDGYWVFLKPFSAGSHNIHFSGGSTDITSTSASNFSTEVTYRLTVK
jgi:hypothetical protein